MEKENLFLRLAAQYLSDRTFDQFEHNYTPEDDLSGMDVNWPETDHGEEPLVVFRTRRGFISLEGHRTEIRYETEGVEKEVEAHVQALDWYPETKTRWVDVYAYETVVGLTESLHVVVGEVDCGSIKVEIPPTAPKCESPDGHQWESPYSLLGGLKENPGVVGNAGGVIITEVCGHCGAYRKANTWDYDPATGEQGLESVTYLEPDEASLEYIRGKEEEDE